MTQGRYEHHVTLRGTWGRDITSQDEINAMRRKFAENREGLTISFVAHRPPEGAGIYRQTRTGTFVVHGIIVPGDYTHWGRATNLLVTRARRWLEDYLKDETCVPPKLTLDRDRCEVTRRDRIDKVAA